MATSTDIRSVAFVGDYLPRKCGIATFTYDLRHSFAVQRPTTECLVVPVNDIAGGYDYPPEVRFEIEEQDLDSYSRAADFLNFANIDIVCLQHEYGIYGGTAGGHVLKLVRDLRIPIVTTLHTILEKPDNDQLRVMRQLTDLSARVITMSERGRQFLLGTYGVPEHKIDLIPHGIPDIPFVDPNFYKDQFGVEGKYVGLTFGLLAPNKGIEHALRALPKIIEQYPNFVYIILGATHPNLVREQGESYRISLERLAQDLGVKKHVIFYNRFVEFNELKEFIGAADIYITPYLNPAQITSGTLAYSFGCGKAVISTPYWHAEELLANGQGVLVPFGDSDAIAREVINLLKDEPRRHAMRKRAYLAGREMVWNQVAHQYMESFQQARCSRVEVPSKRLAVRTLEEEPLQLPKLRLEHLWRMTDSTGIFQHATFTIPNYHEGYCLDDNARALVLMVLLEEFGQDTQQVQRAASTYAAFVNYAFDTGHGHFRNFLGFDRRWLDEVGSDDSIGRATWAIGACVGRSKRPAFEFWGVQLFERALTAAAQTNSPRAWAFAIIGIHEYFRRLSGDRLVNQIREMLTSRLLDLYEQTATDGWQWFEPKLTYDNAKLSHALVLSGRWANNPRAHEIGLRTLHWLAEQQRSPRGHFRPIGSNGFYSRGQQAAEFDQQPLEAHAMVSACIEAYRATEDPYWLKEAHLAFEWFLGRNDLGLPVYDANSGGCRDGLHADRVNQNQGAESTLAFLLALVEMQLLETSLATFRQVAEPTVGHDPKVGLISDTDGASAGANSHKEELVRGA
jgi:glycosyltransferase involved in cell wall biosynthesis